MGSGFGWVHWAGVGLWLGGVGWGNNVHLRLQTHALTWGRALVGWDGVGWGNNVHLRLQTHALRWGRALVGWGGVRWGNNVHLRLQTHALRWGRALVGWGGVITFIFPCKHAHWPGVGLWTKKKWTPLRREALLQAMLKTPHIRTTSEHSHVEKNIRCFFPGSTCRSLHVKNTTRSDHFWTLCKRFVWQTDGNRSKQAKCRTTWKVHFGRLKPVSTQK